MVKNFHNLEKTSTLQKYATDCAELIKMQHKKDVIDCAEFLKMQQTRAEFLKMQQTALIFERCNRLR
jgi:hypothetical protein